MSDRPKIWWSPGRRMFFTAVAPLREGGRVRHYPLAPFYRDQDGELPADAEVVGPDIARVAELERAAWEVVTRYRQLLDRDVWKVVKELDTGLAHYLTNLCRAVDPPGDAPAGPVADTTGLSLGDACGDCHHPLNWHMTPNNPRRACDISGCGCDSFALPIARSADATDRSGGDTTG